MDNASNCDTTAEHFTNAVGQAGSDARFLGMQNRSRCFAHIVDLMSKAFLAPFQIKDAPLDAVCDNDENTRDVDASDDEENDEDLVLDAGREAADDFVLADLSVDSEIYDARLFALKIKVSDDEKTACRLLLTKVRRLKPLKSLLKSFYRSSNFRNASWIRPRRLHGLRSLLTNGGRKALMLANLLPASSNAPFTTLPHVGIAKRHVLSDS